MQIKHHAVRVPKSTEFTKSFFPQKFADVIYTSNFHDEVITSSVKMYTFIVWLLFFFFFFLQNVNLKILRGKV